MICGLFGLGTAGSDTFVFGSSFAEQVITDIQTATSNHDVLQFSHDTFSDVAAVLASAAQVGSDVAINVDASNSSTQHDTMLAHLTVNNFHLV